ncbi:MAG: hydrolase or metal-binding protein [Pseudomonadota bacterium]
MLKGLALTPPEVGRISIGRVVEKNGKRLPEKDDEFTITTQVQTAKGWLNHPLDATLRKSPEAKLRAIPVRLLFSDPDLNMRASYSMFDRRTGRPLCVGNGETCRRSTLEGLKTLACPAPEGCDIGEAGGCKPYARLNVRIGDEDELSSFVFRTTGFNSIRVLSARLRYFQAVSGGLLATLPLELRLRGKSTTQSHRTPIYYVDLTVRSGSTLSAAIEAARAEDAARRAGGIAQDALDEAARQGLAAGAFEDTMEEGAAVVEEFFPTPVQQSGEDSGDVAAPRNLADKLSLKAAQLS